MGSCPVRGFRRMTLFGRRSRPSCIRPTGVKAEALALDPDREKRPRAGRLLSHRSRQSAAHRRAAVVAILGPSTHHPTATNPPPPASSGCGMALGWIGATTAFASVVRKPNNSCCPSTGALFGPRTPRQGVHRPAKATKGRSWLRANFGSCAASCRPTRKTRLLARCSGCACRASRASAGCQHCEYW
jgi:hypothetical protein